VAKVAVSWPDGGAWLLATTSAEVDWQPAAAALAAASTVRTAALVFGAGEPPGDRLRDQIATWVQAGEGAADPLSVDEAVALVRTLAATHGLVLVIGVPGLLVPVGRAGWTPMQLAVAVGAPVVIVAEPERPDAVNHTTLALGAVTGQGLAAAIITVGGPPSPSPSSSPSPGPSSSPGPSPSAAPSSPSVVALSPSAAAFEAGIPVTPAGRIPDGVTEGDFAAAARSWLDPALHASAGRPKADTPQPPPQPLPPPATTSGKRVVLLLAGVFVTMSLVVCGLAFCAPTPEVHTGMRVELTARAEPAGVPPLRLPPGATPVTAPPPPAPTRPVDDVCPQNRPGTKPTQPDGATTKRVNAAWKRIETWLAKHAPTGRRSLRPPATRKQIDAAQRRMSVAFPADLVASLRRHDGVTSPGFTLPLFYDPMPVAEIPREWLMLCGVLVEVFRADDEVTWWHGKFVPFASAVDGGNLFVDQRPSGGGRVGDFYNEDGVNFDGWPTSLAALLEQTATSLETGRLFAGHYRPEVTREGALDWDVV
jgi:cell wall assembly regulator SMI1